MGRAPCCDKANVKKGPWSPEEDDKLKSYIEQHGTGGNWIALPQKIGLKRCGKSCRLRWLNYLRPNLKHGCFSEEEDNIICSLYINIGSRWSIIAAQLPGRTDNDIKNYWNTRLKKKLLGKNRKEQQARYSTGVIVKQESNNRVTNIIGNEYSLSSLVQENNTQQHPYLPQVMIPMPPTTTTTFSYTNQGSCFNDQDSIKKLLIKLGGRFSSDYHHNLSTTNFDGLNLEFSSNATPQQVHGSSSTSCSSSSCVIGNVNDNNNNNQVQLVQGESSGQYFDLVQGQGNFNSEIEMVSTITTTNNNNNYQQRFDGLEFFYGEEMIDNKIIGSSSTTPIYNPVDLNYQGYKV